ncbi:hypothetical protein Hanom_Chr12g01158541 [Helianthus anomalus]
MVRSRVRNTRFILKRALRSTFKRLTEIRKRLGQTMNWSQRVIPKCNLVLRVS